MNECQRASVIQVLKSATIHNNCFSSCLFCSLSSQLNWNKSKATRFGFELILVYCRSFVLFYFCRSVRTFTLRYVTLYRVSTSSWRSSVRTSPSSYSTRHAAPRSWKLYSYCKQRWIVGFIRPAWSSAAVQATQIDSFIYSLLHSSFGYLFVYSFIHHL